MRLAVLLAAAAAALVMAAPSQAHRLPHKPFAQMTTAQKVKYLERQVAHSRGFVRFIERRAAWKLNATRYPAARHARNEYRWHRVSQRIAQANLTRYRRLLRPPLHVAAQAWAFSPAGRCVRSHEGAWTSNTGNGYYGAWQMDLAFQRTYGPEFVRRWGVASGWPAWAQNVAAYRGYLARGWQPWPNTSRMCGLR